MPEMGSRSRAVLRMRGGDGSYILAAVLTTTQRDALTAEEGMVIFNSTTGTFQVYDGSSWAEPGATAVATHAADLDAHYSHMHELLQTGVYYRFPTGETDTLSHPLNSIQTSLIYIPRSGTLDRIAFEVTTEDAGKVARVGLYNLGIDGEPSTLLVDGGEVSIGSAGIKAAVISTAVTRGIYATVYLSNGTAVLRSFGKTSLDPLHWGQLATDLGDNLAIMTTPLTYQALPATHTAGGTKLQSEPIIIAIRYSALT